MTTKRKYDQARKQIEQAQNDAASAMRKGDQKALDEATERGANALAVIAAYKDEQVQKAAATLGHMTSARKAQASRENASKPPRPGSKPRGRPRKSSA